MICNKCKQDKDEGRFEFRKDRGVYRTVCKDCKNVRCRDKYHEIAEKLAISRKNLRDCAKEDFNSKARFRYWKNRDELLDKARNRCSYKKSDPSKVKVWRDKNKHKCSAHQAVHRALKSGKLKKMEMCQMCGKQEKLHAHHADYSKQLQVIWLCIACHKKIHSKFFK